MCTQMYTLLESFATKFFDTFQVPIDCSKRKFLKKFVNYESHSSYLNLYSIIQTPLDYNDLCHYVLCVNWYVKPWTAVKLYHGRF